MFRFFSMSRFFEFWPQVLCVLTGGLGMISVGINSGWPSPTLSILQSGQYYFTVTENEAYWISKALQLGAFCGAPLAASIIDRIGRKRILLLVTVPYLIGWLLIAYGRTMAAFLIARFSAGISEGCIYIALPMYVGEISDKRIRGILGSLTSISSCLGSLIINLVGPHCTIRTTAFVGIAVPVVCFLTFSFMPESPYYFLIRKRVKEAEESLRFLRNSKNVDVELKSVSKDIERMLSEPGRLIDIFRITSNRKSLLIMMGLRLAQQLSGLSVFLNHIKIIFELSGITDIPHEISALLYISLQTGIIVVLMIMVDRFPRKLLLIISFLATSLLLFAQSFYFYAKTELNLLPNNFLNWMPLLLLLIYTIVSVGLSVLPSIVLSELFSSSIKPKALCLMHMYYSLVLIFALEIFQELKYAMFLPFLIYGICCLLSAGFVYVFAPETKGKSLEEIQQIIKNNRF